MEITKAVARPDNTGWDVSFDNETTLYVPNNPGHPHHEKLTAWIAAGGVVTAAEADTLPNLRRRRVEEILSLHGRRAALTIERDYWVSQGGAAARVTALNALLDQARARIDTLRPLS